MHCLRCGGILCLDDCGLRHVQLSLHDVVNVLIKLAVPFFHIARFDPKVLMLCVINDHVVNLFTYELLYHIDCKQQPTFSKMQKVKTQYLSLHIRNQYQNT